MPGSLSTVKYVLLLLTFAVYAVWATDGGLGAIARRLMPRRTARV